MEDDENNLNAFMNNYVYKNPFANEDSCSHSSSGADAKRGVTTSPSSSSSSFSSTPAAGNDTAMSVRRIPADACHQNDVTCVESGSRVDAGSGAGERASGMYAKYLSCREVSFANKKILHWLMENYQFVESYTGTVEAQAIVRQVNSIFPGAFSESLLLSLMKFGFPHCLHLTSKSVTHFVGLIERPRDEDADNQALRDAAQHVSVSSGGGLMLLEEVASLYQVPVNKLASIVYWANPATLPSNQTKARNLRKKRKIDSSAKQQTTATDDHDSNVNSTKRFKSIHVAQSNSKPTAAKALRGQNTTPSTVTSPPERFFTVKSEPLDDDSRYNTRSVAAAAAADNMSDGGSSDQHDDLDITDDSGESAVNSCEGPEGQSLGLKPDLGRCNDSRYHLSPTGNHDRDSSRDRLQSTETVEALRYELVYSKHLIDGLEEELQQSRQETLALRHELRQRDVTILQLADRFCDLQDKFQLLFTDFRKHLDNLALLPASSSLHRST